MTSLFSHEESAQSTPEPTALSQDAPFFSQPAVDEPVASFPSFDPTPRFIEPW